MTIYTFENQKKNIRSTKKMTPPDENVNQKIYRLGRYNLYLTIILLFLFFFGILYCYFKGILQRNTCKGKILTNLNFYGKYIILFDKIKKKYTYKFVNEISQIKFLCNLFSQRI